MSDKLKKEQLKDVAGGAGELDTGKPRNPGGACMHYVCDICGASASDESTVYDNGVCTFCFVRHEMDCKYWVDEHYTAGCCDRCQHRAINSCGAP